MKLSYLACALVAALAYSQPIEEPAGLGEIEPQPALLSKREPAQLEKRANTQFEVFPTDSEFESFQYVHIYPPC
jgi:hypothetical protein